MHTCFCLPLLASDILHVDNTSIPRAKHLSDPRFATVLSYLLHGQTMRVKCIALPSLAVLSQASLLQVMSEKMTHHSVGYVPMMDDAAMSQSHQLALSYA